MRQAGSLGHWQLLGPLRIVAWPVGVGGQVDPDAGVGEAHNAPVRHPRHTGLEVVHDPKCLYGRRSFRLVSWFKRTLLIIGLLDFVGFPVI